MGSSSEYEKLSDVNQISYTYDENGDTGLLTYADYGNNNSKAYDYDILGRLSTVTTTIENEDFVMHYDYNLNGDIKEIIYPNDWVLSYDFNNIGQIDTVSLDRGSGASIVADNIGYNQNGQMTYIERANGVSTSYLYDPEQNFRLEYLDTSVNTATGTMILQYNHYEYDNVGNIKKITDNYSDVLPKTAWYDYDDIYRLASSTVNYTNNPGDDYTQEFSYDEIGNMTYNSELGIMDYLNDNPHQLSGYATRTFSYDDAGNQTNNGGFDKFAWDHRSRLKNTYDIPTEDKTYYKYDHNNQRMLKYSEDYIFVPPDIHRQVIEAAMIKNNNLVQMAAGGSGYWEWQRTKEDKYVEGYFEKDLANNTKTHILLNGSKIATIKNNEEPEYYLSDHLGSNSIVLDHNGNVTELSDFMPYGKINYETGSSENEYKFTDKEVDEETDVQYFGARYYDNEIGNFLSLEPVMMVLHDGDQLKAISGKKLQNILSDPQALNSYSYSRNNPVILVDADGNWWKAFFTGQQSWGSFQTELGQAANQLYSDSDTAKTIMDNPAKASLAIGVGSGLAAYGASAAITPVLTQLGVLGTQADKIVDFTQRFGNNVGSRMNDINNVISNKGYKFYDHALKRMAERNINPNTVLDTVKNNKSFEYFHNGVMKNGYYNQDVNLFVGQLQSSKEITTVINNVKPSYINNLTKTIK